MLSEKQKIANQNNAKLGGVKTDDGKAKIRLNALKHGLLSKQVLINSENQSELLALEKSLIEDFEPQSQFEAFLVDKIVSGIWRLKRAINIEKNIFTMGQENPFKVEIGSEDFIEAKVVREMIDDNLLDRLLRYETTLERGIFKASHELQRIIASRSGEKIMTPIAVDFNLEERF